MKINIYFNIYYGFMFMKNCLIVNLWKLKILWYVLVYSKYNVILDICLENENFLVYIKFCLLLGKLKNYGIILMNEIFYKNYFFLKCYMY